MVIIDEPSVERLICSWFAVSQTKLGKLLLDLPLMTKWDADRAISGLPLLDTKYDWWNLPSLSYITNTAFYCWWGSPYALCSHTEAKGALSLPSLRCLSWDDDNGTPLNMMTNVVEISLGGADYRTTVTNICSNAFAGDSHLETLTIHASSDINVGTNIFADYIWSQVAYPRTAKGSLPSVIRFTGRAPSETAISNLLESAVAAEEKPVRIYASKYQIGWMYKSPVDWIDRDAAAITTADRYLAAGDEIIGVYRGGCAAPLGKALILHRSNSWDTPVGLSLTIR